MTNDLYTIGGAIVLLIISFIKIPKIEFNIWGLIGKSFNQAIVKKIDEIDSKCDDIEMKLNRHLEEEELDKAQQARKRVLVFNAEMLRGQNHTEEQFNEILLDIDSYEDYCSRHPDYANTKAVLSIENIKSNYLKYMQEGNFLK